MYKRQPWWINVDLCGGQIYEQAIHVYDLCRYLMGEPKYAAGVMGNVCHNHIHNYTVEDVSASFAGFTNGAVAAITANNCEVPGEWIGRFKVVYEKVTADFRDFNHAVFTYTGEGGLRTETVDCLLYTSKIPVFYEADKAIYFDFSYPNPWLQEAIQIFAAKGRNIEELFRDENQTYDKCLIFLPDTEAAGEIKVFLDEHFYCIPRGGHVWEVTQKDYTKATGIRFMCSHLDADMENCFAVGDSENDLDLSLIHI